MKKRMVPLYVLIMISCLLTGCCLSHEWQEASCKSPRTCAKCGKSKGAALGHQWVEATCTEGSYCMACDLTKGEALGHQWVEATCLEAKHCSVCALTEGEALGHTLEGQIILRDSGGLMFIGSCPVCKEKIEDDGYYGSFDKLPIGKWIGDRISMEFYEDGTYLVINDGKEGTGAWSTGGGISAPQSEFPDLIIDLEGITTVGVYVKGEDTNMMELLIRGQRIALRRAGTAQE